MAETLVGYATSLLNGAAYAYLVAVFLYITCLVVRGERVGKTATLLALGGVIAHTAALLLRWVAAGFTTDLAPTTRGWEWVMYILKHPPYTNLYESLIFFAWGIVLVYLLMEIGRASCRERV